MRVVVIGAGIVGASVAFRLSQGGARVWLVDKAEPASGTTAASFAWINANNKMPREYFELNRAGMEEHFRLPNEFAGVAPWLYPGGNLIWAEGEELRALESRVERLKSWGYAAEWWTASRVRNELETEISFSDPDSPVAFFPREAWVDAALLAKFLLDRAVEYGAMVRPGTGVVEVEMGGGRVSGVSVEGGEHISADAVVNAAGPGAGHGAAMVGRGLTLDLREGLLVRVATGGRVLERLLHTSRVNLRPDGPKHILLHHGSVDEQLAGGDREHLSEKLLERAREIIPALHGAEIEEIRTGIRPMPADGLSCVGAVTGLPGYYEAVTHSGVTLGPLIGRLLSLEIMEEDVSTLLASFRPDRF